MEDIFLPTADVNLINLYYLLVNFIVEENKDIAMPERMRMATARWVAMTSEEKEGFKKKAKEEAEKQETVESYSAADRRALRKRTIKEILNLVRNVIM